MNFKIIPLLQNKKVQREVIKYILSFSEKQLKSGYPVVVHTTQSILYNSDRQP